MLISDNAVISDILQKVITNSFKYKFCIEKYFRVVEVEYISFEILKTFLVQKLHIIIVRHHILYSVAHK